MIKKLEMDTPTSDRTRAARRHGVWGVGKKKTDLSSRADLCSSCNDRHRQASDASIARTQERDELALVHLVEEAQPVRVRVRVRASGQG